MDEVREDLLESLADMRSLPWWHRWLNTSRWVEARDDLAASVRDASAWLEHGKGDREERRRMGDALVEVLKQVVV